MLKRAVIGVVIVLIAVAMFVFTDANKGDVDVHLLFAEVSTSLPVAFTVAFAVGWLFGILCMSFWAFKLINERRLLRRALKVSESEVSTLRNLPLSDAD
jgi:uncharacterized integral membrane protein